MMWSPSCSHEHISKAGRICTLLLLLINELYGASLLACLLDLAVNEDVGYVHVTMGTIGGLPLPFTV